MRIVAALPVVLALLHTPPGGAVFPSGLPAAAQSAAEAETLLELDRPSRRLIQQGLRNEGFDPGTPDGLFGPRTRGAIRAWQAARGHAATGYLDGAQAELLRAAAAGNDPALPPQTATRTTAPHCCPTKCIWERAWNPLCWYDWDCQKTNQTQEKPSPWLTIIQYSRRCSSWCRDMSSRAWHASTSRDGWPVA